MVTIIAAAQHTSGRGLQYRITGLSNQAYYQQYVKMCGVVEIMQMVRSHTQFTGREVPGSGSRLVFLGMFLYIVAC